MLGENNTDVTTSTFSKNDRTLPGLCGSRLGGGGDKEIRAGGCLSNYFRDDEG